MKMRSGEISMNNNMFKYISNYGNLTFEEKSVTEIDILIFSQISYLNFNNIFINQNEEIKLLDLWQKARKNNIESQGFGHKVAFKLLDIISTKKRYKDLILKNYVYILEEDTQFGAISIIVPNDSIYVSFEGTDNTIWGWKEDFKLTYIYPTESQRYAASYLNNAIKLNGPNVIVCGHSKGGNLALVGAMNTNIIKKLKIKKIYSFDGPGLKDEEFKSIKYKIIRNKLVNIIPNLSLVGILLNQENKRVIKSRGVGIFQHDVTTWQIEEDYLKPSTQDKLSKRLEDSISDWLNKYNYKEREEIIEGVFSIFETSGINNFNDIDSFNDIYIIVKSSLDMSKETREVILNAIKLLVTDFSTELINDSKKEIQDNLEKIFKREEQKK